nr:MAG TPA: hypothetical protein [Caudoviricetes sp.]
MSDKNVGDRHLVSPGDKNVAPTPTKMSGRPIHAPSRVYKPLERSIDHV